MTYLGAIEDVCKKFFENIDNIKYCIKIYYRVKEADKRDIDSTKFEASSANVMNECEFKVKKLIEEYEEILLCPKRLLFGLMRLKRDGNSQTR